MLVTPTPRGHSVTATRHLLWVAWTFFLTGHCAYHVVPSLRDGLCLTPVIAERLVAIAHLLKPSTGAAHGSWRRAHTTKVGTCVRCLRAHTAARTLSACPRAFFYRPALVTAPPAATTPAFFDACRQLPTIPTACIHA